MAAMTDRSRRRFRMPLSFVVGRYFLYILLGAIFIIGIPTIILMSLFGSGQVLPANYGENNIDRIEQVLIEQDGFDASAIPSAFWYAHLSSDGEVLATDMNDARLNNAKLTLSGTKVASYQALQLKDGSWCVLRSEVMPQWSSRTLRDTWPNPQDLNIWSIGLLLVVLVMGMALRASHVLTCKMAPLVVATEAVGNRDLDFSVGTSDVIQIDNVLAAMEQMRVSLKASLEEQWAAEARQRDEVASLAHDLKTPLTVIRGNADLLLEDAEPRGLSDEQRACVRALHSATLQADARVADIISASCGERTETTAAPVDLSDFADKLEKDSRSLAESRKIAFHFSRSTAFDNVVEVIAKEEPLRPVWDMDALLRAVTNLISNACDHTHVGGYVKLELDYDTRRTSFAITVEDDGPGYPAVVLEHGRERFVRGDITRQDTKRNHFGLGLAIVDDIARAHRGYLELSNHERDNTTGARATIVLPSRNELP